ncbi:MAG: hypothetical protein U0796_23070 [Gemmatales bacterium]
MRLYHGKTLLLENANFTDFTKAYAKAVYEKSSLPFLLVRGDDARLLVVTHDSRIMMCRADWPGECYVSYDSSSYLDGSQRVMGLAHSMMVKDAFLIDPAFAIKAIQSFFTHKPMGDFVDFCHGTPEPELTSFPSPFKKKKNVKRELVEMHVTISEELKADMHDVCEFLGDNEGDPDVYIDYDDAIQIGSLCGGRINRRRNIFIFTYYLRNGDKWQFEVPRTVLDGIADGTITKLTVEASVPKNLR